jgi:hypothetical protein
MCIRGVVSVESLAHVLLAVLVRPFLAFFPPAWCSTVFFWKSFFVASSDSDLLAAKRQVFRRRGEQVFRLKILVNFP